MLLEEAKWFGNEISRMSSSDIFPMLNIGSSIASCRENDQPWTDSYIFKPARDAGQKIVHIDIKDKPGVDMVGDISNKTFQDRLKKIEFKSIFCANLLEHVEDRESIVKAITSMTPSGGYIFVSCPFRYPYHLDPIDTMFRPGIDELARLFPGTAKYKAEVIKDHNYWFYIATPNMIINRVIRICAPFYRPKKWLTVLAHMAWLFRDFHATCLILKKG